ncbi:MAG: hypothetical protein ACLUEL_00495 [Akkermansia muciniphila]
MAVYDTIGYVIGGKRAFFIFVTPLENTSINGKVISLGKGHEAVFAEVGAPWFSRSPLKLHIHAVRVPPDKYRNNVDSDTNISFTIRHILLYIIQSYKGIKAQQDGMAHVRVAVVHHFQVRRGIRRNQRAGSASVPLKGGGSVLAFPLRGGVPHVRPQVKLVPGADRPVPVRRVAVLGRVRTQPYVRRIATKFRRQFFLRKYDIQVFF